MKLMKSAAAVMAAGLLAMGSSANAQEVIAYWNFNDAGTGDYGLAGTGTLAADQGAGSISTNFIDANITNTAGSTINAISPDGSGSSLTLQGGTGVAGTDCADATGANNGAWVDIAFDATGYENLEISYATRGTGTGFDCQEIEVSTNGGSSFSPVTTITGRRSTTFSLQGTPLPGAADDTANVVVRIIFRGATNASGNNRIDNLRIEGTEIPAAGVDYTASGSISIDGVDLADPLSDTFTVTSTGPAVQITGVSGLPTGFTVVTPLPATVPANDSIQIEVQYEPAANDGSAVSGNATFTTDSNPATFDVSISGSSVREVPLAQAKAEYEAQTAPWTAQTRYKVSGVVSANTTGAANRNLVAIQDLTDGSSATRGIAIDDPSANGLDGRPMPGIGETVTVIGTIGNFHGVVQLTPDRAYDIDSSSPVTITPRVVTDADLGDETESVLLQVNGVTSDSDQTAIRNTNTTLLDGISQPFTFRIDNNDNFDPPFEIEFDDQTSYTVRGIGGQFASSTNEPIGGGGYQVIGRSADDVIDEATSVADWYLMD